MVLLSFVVDAPLVDRLLQYGVRASDISTVFDYCTPSAVQGLSILTMIDSGISGVRAPIPPSFGSISATMTTQANAAELSAATCILRALIALV